MLELFVETFARVSNFYFADRAALPESVVRDVCRAHDAIAKAILTNNPGLARERMRRHLGAEADFIRAQPDTVQRLDPAVALAARSATSAARPWRVSCSPRSSAAAPPPATSWGPRPR